MMWPSCPRLNTAPSPVSPLRHARSSVDTTACLTLMGTQLGDKLYEAGEHEQSVEWYLKSAEQGNKDAIYSVGWAYYSGEGVDQNHAEAAVWFEQGIELEHPKAMRVMAKMFYTGNHWHPHPPTHTKTPTKKHKQTNKCTHPQALARTRTHVRTHNIQPQQSETALTRAPAPPRPCTILVRRHA